MAKPIGIWTAAELLADTLQPASSEAPGIKSKSAPTLAAFEFLQLSAGAGRCSVKGRRGHNGMWEPIAADLWISLTIDPIAAESDDDAEYSEAQAHPTKSGPDYQKNLWNDLRWNRAEIEALRPCFRAWHEAGRPPALPDTQTALGGAIAREAEHQVRAPGGETPLPSPEEGSEEARAADESSRAMKRAYSSKLFAESYWPVQRVVRWIAFRDSNRIEDSVKAARHYAASRVQMVDVLPEKTLLHALQHDNLRALDKDGRERPRDAWASATGHEWPDVRFRREDVLALWCDPSSDDALYLAFKEIAHRWSKLAGEQPEKMLGALVSAFWRGAFERNGESRVFTLVLANGQHAYSSAHEGDAVVNISEDGERSLTTERRTARMRRREVAEVLGGNPNYVPWHWNGTEDGLTAYAKVPYTAWPASMRTGHFEEWRFFRGDFGEWYAGSGIWPKPSLESMWPGATPAHVTSIETTLGPTSPTSAKTNDFESRLGWVPLRRALEIVEKVTGGVAWEEMKTAIRHTGLRARGLADGVTVDFEPHWLDFLAWDSPESRSNLSFDREKALRRGVRVPNRIENIVVQFARVAELWPGCAVGNAGASDVLDATPEAVPASAPPPETRTSASTGYWTLCEALTWIAWREPFNSMELRAADGVIPGSGDLHARIAAVRKSEAYSTKVVMAEMEEAARELWRHIAERDIEAIGRPAWGVDTELKRIDPYWFLETPPPKALYLFDQICADEANKGTKHRGWKDVRFSRSKLMRLQSGPETLHPIGEGRELRQAPEAEIHAAIAAVYDRAEREQAKPPNLRELVATVQPLLAESSYKASGLQIQSLAAAPQHAQRRRKPGKTVASELARQRQ